MKSYLTPIALLIGMAALIYTSYNVTNRQTDSNNRLAKATEDLLQQSQEFTRAADRLAEALERQTTPNRRTTKP